MKILIVEDDADLREVISAALRKERFNIEEAPTCSAARSKVAIYQYDCVLLDIMLPDGNGLDILKLIREKNKETSVIILSAKDSVDDKVAGLDLGADDYLAKPFHLAELSARIRNVMRRHKRNGDFSVSFGNVTIFPDSFRVEVKSAEISLGRKEYDILHFFMNRKGKLVEKQVLAEGVWGDDADQVDNFDFVYAQIKNLRRHLKEAGADIDLKSVYGIGYRMVEL